MSYHFIHLHPRQEFAKVAWKVRTCVCIPTILELDDFFFIYFPDEYIREGEREKIEY